MRRSHAQRGQAVVELALSMLVFITVLVFGIHFAEVSYLSVRVQEAAAFAIYDATGQRTHEKGNQRFNLSSTAPGLSTSEARKKWGDFEANSGGDWANAKVSHVFTEIDQIYNGITCRKETSINYSTSIPVVGVVTPNPFSGGDNEGGMRCTASAQVSIAPGFPKKFFDGKWNLKSDHYAGNATSYKICATPRSVNGQCGEFGLLIGDFSLQGVAESKSHDLYSGGNDDYKNLVNDAMGLTACVAAQALSLGVAFTASYDACSFHFSYMGVEKNYKQNINSVHTGPTQWITGGTNTKRQINNPRTYLGVSR